MSSKKSILVVDDQTNVRNILEFNLKRRGFEVLSAQDGLAALTMAATNTPQLILLDIMMPGIDGFQVLEKLRTDPKTASIPVLIVSAKGTENDILHAMKLGAKDYIVKPFNLEQLIQKAFRLIEGSEKPADKSGSSVPPVSTNGAAPPPGSVPTAGAVPTGSASWPTWSVIRIGSEYPVEDDAFVAYVGRLAESGSKAVILDLEGTGAISALAFGKLARTQQQARKSGSVIRFVSASESHKKTLQESNFAKHFQSFALLDEAIKDESA